MVCCLTSWRGNQQSKARAVPKVATNSNQGARLAAFKFMAIAVGKRPRRAGAGRKLSTSLYKLDAVPLGSGKFGVVYRAVEKSTNHVVTVKAIPKSEAGRINIDGEIDMWQRFSNHPNIRAFICSYETQSEIHVVGEYMYGGAIINVIPRHGLQSEQDAVEYMKELAAALCYLHRNCVAHRNLTPENLMLTHGLGGVLKVCDFRCAKALPTENAPIWDVCGTCAYAAPEVLWLQRTSEGSYTLKCDMFSAGVILYLLLVGHHPFDPWGNHAQKEMIEKICQGVWKFDKESWYGVSVEAKSVVTALLEVDPMKRLTAKQLACHPWARGSIPFGHSTSTNNCLMQSLECISSKICKKKSNHGVRFGNLAKIAEHSGSTKRLDVVSNATKTISGKASPDESANANEQTQQQSPPKSEATPSSLPVSRPRVDKPREASCALRKKKTASKIRSTTPRGHNAQGHASTWQA